MMAPSAIANTPKPIVPHKTVNGVINGHIESTKIATQDEHSLVLATFRCLIADLCEQFKGGHPGSAMGMAAIGIALWKYVLRYSPANPNWFNRDRFVLSNGEFVYFPTP
jgi:dihydroxyacetone synthase